MHACEVVLLVTGSWSLTLCPPPSLFPAARGERDISLLRLFPPTSIQAPGERDQWTEVQSPGARETLPPQARLSDGASSYVAYASHSSVARERLKHELRLVCCRHQSRNLKLDCQFTAISTQSSSTTSSLCPQNTFSHHTSRLSSHIILPCCLSDLDTRYHHIPPSPQHLATV